MKTINNCIYFVVCTHYIKYLPFHNLPIHARITNVPTCTFIFEFILPISFSLYNKLIWINIDYEILNMWFQHISFRLMKRTIAILWFEVLCLVCAPFFGFGLYWDETQCKDFQDAEKPLDVLYFYLYFGHGK